MLPTAMISKCRALPGFIVTRAAAPIVTVLGLLSSLGWSRRRCRAAGKSREREPPTIVVTGGELYNRGAQAMTFTLIGQLRKRYPSSRIYLFSGRDEDAGEVKQADYSFAVLPWSWRTRLAVFNVVFRPVAWDKRQIVAEARKILDEAAFVVDISGYALSSQWGATASVYCLLNMMIAARRGIPFYLFPQSVGPLDYSFPGCLLLPRVLIRRCIDSTECLFVREPSGVECLEPIMPGKARQHPDLLLAVPAYEPALIYATPPRLSSAVIPEGAVGVVPSVRVAERLGGQQMIKLYEAVIGRLSEAGKCVCFVSHSTEDLRLCDDLKARFKSDPGVLSVGGCLNALELEKLIGQFEFTVASRYHAIVHGYRNGVPSVMLGWAAKYRELAAVFGQGDYVVDSRDKASVDTLLSKLDRMLSEYDLEREKINRRMDLLPSPTLFELLP